MSATNHTSTIELSQYISTDKPTYLTDYNGDMLKIDNAIAADRDSIATAQLKADTADGKADINKTSIDSLNVQLNGDPEDPTDVGVAGDVNALEGTVNTVTALLGNGSPTTSDQTVIGAINGLEGAIAPREDGTTLANSYSIGDQFARGGSVYEALASLTAGTAFASLVLNTDYKVADTLVEQIGNAVTELPDVYGLKAARASITSDPADGTMTYVDLIANMASKLLAFVPTLADDEMIVITAIKEARTASYLRPKDESIFKNNYTSLSLKFESFNLDAQYQQCDIYNLTMLATAVGSSESMLHISGSTMTYTNIGTQTATSGQTITLYYDLYKKL